MSAALHEQLKEKLAQSGELEVLRLQLRERLIESGWRDQLAEQCRQLVHERGYENITVDQLAHELMPAARSTVPDSIKAELLKRIKESLQK